MPQGEHSSIQIDLCEAINRVAKTQKIAKAFPKLRCTFDDKSIVPDIAVFRWERIPLSPSGRIANRFETHPDWSIEILSPEQNMTKALGKLLLCSRNGTELGWLINTLSTFFHKLFNNRLKGKTTPSFIYNLFNQTAFS